MSVFKLSVLIEIYGQYDVAHPLVWPDVDVVNVTAKACPPITTFETAVLHSILFHPRLQQVLGSIPHKNMYMFQTSHALQSSPVPEPKDIVLRTPHPLGCKPVDKGFSYELLDQCC